MMLISYCCEVVTIFVFFKLNVSIFVPDIVFEYSTSTVSFRCQNLLFTLTIWVRLLKR